MGNLFGRLAARHRAFILALAWFTGGFQFLMCAVVAELHLESVLAQLMNFVPQVLRGALELVLLGG
ncbi:MAG: hypothetical protein FIB01_13115, partial [Gemmatimonadetes bacterium]|nr:hypothetical protein [Gemmatimonadota bacterium]